jgi:hypothetical protein
VDYAATGMSPEKLDDGRYLLFTWPHAEESETITLL